MWKTSKSHILPLQKQSRNNVDQIFQKWSVQNAHCPEGDANNKQVAYPPSPEAKSEWCRPNCPKNGAYEMLVAQEDAITKITGIITPESMDTLKNKLGGAFTIVKSTHFVDGQR
jgi:hypothetical protein